MTENDFFTNITAQLRALTNRINRPFPSNQMLYLASTELIDIGRQLGALAADRTVDDARADESWRRIGIGGPDNEYVRGRNGEV